MKKQLLTYRNIGFSSSLAAISLCFFLFLNALNSHASQPESVAVVIAVRGGAQAIGADDTIRKLQIKSPLYENDLLSTDERGRLQIMFTDNTIISLGRQASLQISEYILNKDQTGKLTTKVTEGVFRVMGGILTKNSPDDFNTLTPSGNIGIRGSMYTGQVTNGETAIVFEGGKGITFRNQTGLITISQPGNGTRVKGLNSMIPTPHKFNQKDLQAMQKALVIRSAMDTGTKSQTTSAFKVPIRFSPKSEASQKGKDQSTADKQEDTGKKQGEAELPELAEKQEIDDLTRQVKDNPEEADQILQDAVKNKGVKVEKALEAVLKGMRNPTKEDFDQLKNLALDMGITVDGAKELIKTLKESGELCK